jgi:hypothetical protein
MDKFIYLIAGAALTWLFYLVQRRVERRGAVEAIERNQKLLDLKQGLDSANTNLDDLRQFEHRLIGKAETAARIADNYFTKAEEVARQSDDAAVTQSDMNAQAAGEQRRADQGCRERGRQWLVHVESPRGPVHASLTRPGCQA